MEERTNFNDIQNIKRKKKKKPFKEGKFSSKVYFHKFHYKRENTYKKNKSSKNKFPHS